MPISGLVVMFDGPADQHSESLHCMGQEPCIERGPINGNKCAIVLDTQSKLHDQQVWSWIRNLPGVIDVQLCFVDVQDEDLDQQLDESGKLNES